MVEKNYWFKHDANARRDPKMKKIRREKGLAAKAVYWDMVEMLRESETGKLDIDATIEDIQDEDNLPDSSIPMYLIFDSGLFEHDSIQFWSPRLLREIEYAKARAEVNRTNGQRGGRPKKETEQEPNGNRIETEQKPSRLANGNPEETTDNSIQITDNSNKSEYIDNNILSMEIEVVPLITPEELKDMWNNGRGKCAKVIAVTDERREKALARLSEFGSTREEQERTILALMEKIRSSSLLQSKSWCSFDWLIKNSTNWVKVMEDKYRNEDIAAGVKDIRDIKNINEVLWDRH